MPLNKSPIFLFLSLKILLQKQTWAVKKNRRKKKIDKGPNYQKKWLQSCPKVRREKTMGTSMPAMSEKKKEKLRTAQVLSNIPKF
jgi:hypothetical protein